MSEQMPNDATASSCDVTSTDMCWPAMPEFDPSNVVWLDERRGSVNEPMPPVDRGPSSAVLITFPFALPRLHEGHPMGPKAMGDSNRAKRQLRRCKSGAWLLSPYTGWCWAKWHTGDVGWVPANVELPNCLRVQWRYYAE